MITERKNGHMYYGTSMEAAEGSDNCGTCDGANCEECISRFTVDGESKSFRSRAEAEDFENSRGNKMEGLIPTFSRKEFSAPNFYLNEDGTKLIASWYRSFTADGQYITLELRSVGFKSGEVEIVCNRDSELFEEYFKAAQDRRTAWENCKCSDKANPAYGNSCDIGHNCNDSRCYFEMCHKNRRERKWYM